MHDDDCEKVEFEGGICTCSLSPTGYSAYNDDEPSNMYAMENGDWKRGSVVNTDPEAHSIHIEGNHIALTIEPGDVAVSCHSCYRTYRTGEWRLLLVDMRNVNGEQLHMCKSCVAAIMSALPKFPSTPAPWVEY